MLTRITMRFERDVGPWFPLPLQALLLAEYGELPAGTGPAAGLSVTGGAEVPEVSPR